MANLTWYGDYDSRYNDLRAINHLLPLIYTDRGAADLLLSSEEMRDRNQNVLDHTTRRFPRNREGQYLFSADSWYDRFRRYPSSNVPYNSTIYIATDESLTDTNNTSVQLLFKGLTSPQRTRGFSTQTIVNGTKALLDDVYDIQDLFLAKRRSFYAFAVDENFFLRVFIQINGNATLFDVHTSAPAVNYPVLTYDFSIPSANEIFRRLSLTNILAVDKLGMGEAGQGIDDFLIP